MTSFRQVEANQGKVLRSCDDDLARHDVRDLARMVAALPDEGPGAEATRRAIVVALVRQFPEPSAGPRACLILATHNRLPDLRCPDH
jgi:hypothetical protein